MRGDKPGQGDGGGAIGFQGVAGGAFAKGESSTIGREGISKGPQATERRADMLRSLEVFQGRFFALKTC